MRRAGAARIRAVHQLVPTFGGDDAIGNDVRALRGLLREWGYASDVYAQNIDQRLAREARFYTRYREVSDPANVVLFHFSIGSEVTSFVAGLPDRKVLLYHNITPPEYFARVNPRVADRCRRGRRELGRLAAVPDLALGDSEFNRAELEAAGFRRTGVLPILVDWAGYALPPVPALEGAYGCGTNLLYVGRVAPNKRIEDLIKTYYFHRRLDPGSRLLVVGSAVDMEPYLAACQKLAAELGVLDGVVFTGPVPQADLVTYYRLAAVYLSLSDHEGFCVPLLEAMHFGVPVVAHAAGAVPWTMGGAGLLVAPKEFPAIAELIHRVVTEPGLRRAVVDGQRERLTAFDREAVGAALRGYLGAL
jgi:glycosyltransferase involved in cell wall biosynthesis